MIEFENFAKSVSSHIGKYNFTKLAKATSLYPLDYLSYSPERRRWNLFQYHWIDDFNTKISVIHKHLEIKLNNLNQQYLTNDEWINLDIQQIAKISKSLLISGTKDDIYISFYRNRFIT